MLILLKANAAYTEYTMKTGPGYDVDVLTLLAEAVRKANDNFNFGSAMSPSAMSRGEMALVNGRARYLYGQLNKPQEANERQWIERFYGMTDDERDSFGEGDIIEIVAPGQTVMQAPSESAKDFDRLEENRRKQLELQDKTDRIGSQTIPTDHRADELYQNDNDFYEFFRAERGKRRKNQSRASVRYKLVRVDVEMYQKTNVRANGVGALFELPLKLAKHGINLRRLEEYTEYRNRKEVLQRQIRNERQYVVPLKPEKIEILVKQIQRHGRITSNPFEKTQVQLTLHQLERMWEESNAFWKNRR